MGREESLTLSFILHTSLSLSLFFCYELGVEPQNKEEEAKAQNKDKSLKTLSLLF